MNAATLAKVIAWLVTAMIAWVPLDGNHPHNTRESYESIATDAARTAFDPSETPLWMSPRARSQAALMLLSIASLESAYQPEIDDGRIVGDGGASWCILQIHLPGNATVRPDGDSFAYGGVGAWTGRDLVNDRTRCMRIGLHMVRASVKKCGDLRGYVAGGCIRVDDGMTVEQAAKMRTVLRLAENRYLRATRFATDHPSPALDSEVLP